MAGRYRLGFLSLVICVSLSVLACERSDPGPTAAGPTATPETRVSEPAPATPGAAPSPTAAPLEPDGERILQDVRHLADTIGPRPAGTSRETAAAEYIATKLRSFGYEVTLQEFSIATESARESSLSVQAAGGQPNTIPALPLERSGSAQVRGRLMAAGRGGVAEFPPDIRGNIALIERGDLQFVEKVANAQRAGAAGVVIYNNEPGIFYGSLGQSASLPAVSISQNEGQALANSLRNGAVEASLSVAAPGSGTSRNVVAKPPGRDCETVSGGHYDSVPQAPGASDNATGTATVIEIAAVVASRGEMGGNCFVLFGGEELGLLGSRAFVEALTPAQRRSLKAMFNYDMVGVGDEGWLLLGSTDLQTRGLGEARALGISGARGGQLPRNTSSDHASFLAAGIPALMLYRLDDPLLHTPQDVSGRVSAELLEEATRLGVAVLESLARGS